MPSKDEIECLTEDNLTEILDKLNDWNKHKELMFRLCNLKFFRNIEKEYRNESTDFLICKFKEEITEFFNKLGFDVIFNRNNDKIMFDEMELADIVNIAIMLNYVFSKER